MGKNTILFIVILVTLSCSIALTAERTLLRQDYVVLEDEGVTE